MKTLRHPVAAIVLLMVFMGLFVGIYKGFEQSYEIERDSLDSEGRTIGEALSDLTLINDIQSFVQDILNVVAPKNPLDVIGGLLSAGIGILLIISGIVTFPLKILAVFVGFYPGIIPPIVERAIDVLVSVFVAFIILSAIIRSKV